MTPIKEDRATGQPAVHLPPPPHPPAENPSTFDGGPKLEPAEFNHLTISDDHSHASAIDERRFLALRQPESENAPQPSLPTAGRAPMRSINDIKPAGPGSSNQEKQDYSMQLMLLEQQNRRRLMLARQGQEEWDKLDLPQQEAAALGDSRKRPSNSGPSGSGMRKTGRHPGSDDKTSDVQALQKQVALLEAKLKTYESTQQAPTPSRVQVLYRLHNSSSSDDIEFDPDDKRRSNSVCFTDVPDVVPGQKGGAHIRCNDPLWNFELHLALNRDITLIVFRDYHKNLQPENPDDKPVTHLPQPFSESVYPATTDLKQALSALLHKPEFRDVEKTFSKTGEVFAPYLFFYHSREEIKNIRSQLPEAAADQLDLFMQYVQDQFGDEYRVVDEMLAQKQISPQYINYLFKPGDILVEKVKDQYQGYVADSWISKRTWNPHTEMQKEDPEDLLKDPFAKPPNAQFKKVKAFTLKFDGAFHRSSKVLEIEIPQEDPMDREGLMQKPRSIDSFNVFPLKYASEEVSNTLQKRGHTFWGCRTRKLVSYQEDRNKHTTDTVSDVLFLFPSYSDSNTFQTDERYMIDAETYKKLHPPAAWKNYGNRYLDASELNQEKPPRELEFLFPPSIKGYNLRRKKWYEISVDYISDVTWNREAFRTLVVESKAKDLIQALVTSQLETEKSTDLIAGKGNGLILLLHGGPGTGKTLTAESVAEIAEKPLYRVTCGDVGTKAEEVEKYLESVLYLGRIWGCVVLLDEADVFLEQRGLEDLERNALVSVFLRVLEYYDGILILTSNRVGTFDEAFRSRIQLALHYPNLDPEQRFQIWQTFIDRLDTFHDGEDIDIADIRGHLHILKHEKLNGRQIRNIITTARQYARWKKTTLTYGHLKDVIQVSGRFDRYLDNLHGGSSDELAQDDGLRLAQ